MTIMDSTKKRKHSLESASSSPLDALWKRQRRLSSTSHSPSPYPSSSTSSSYLNNRASLSDSDEEDAGPSTPSFVDDNMDWSPDVNDNLLPVPNQLRTRRPPGRDSSSSPAPGMIESSNGGAIHHLQLMREAEPPKIVPYAHPPVSRSHAQQHRSPTMKMEIRPDAYLFAVELPGYAPEAITVSCKKGNVVTVVADIWHASRESLQHWDITFDSDVHTAEIRASLDRTTHVLTITARRFRQYIPIEHRVPTSYLHAKFHHPTHMMPASPAKTIPPTSSMRSRAVQP